MISVIIPAYNESENIRRFPDELLPPLRALPEPFELVIVDDGSTDDTVAEARKISDLHPATTIVTHPRNLGLGAAIRSGIAAAKGDLLVTLDADLTFSPNDIPLLYRTWKETGSDCVIGSHLLSRSGFQGVPRHRAFLSRGVNFLYRRLLSQSLTAISSIFRLYRKSALDRLPLDSTGFTINAEILVKLIDRRAKVTEVPAVLSSRRFGTSKLRMGSEIRNHLFVLWTLMSRRMKTIPLPAVSLFALLLLRGAWSSSYVGYFVDDAAYILAAKALLAGKGYVQLSWPGDPPERLYLPGFPLLLLPVVPAVGEHPEELKWVTTILATLGLPAAYLLFRDKLPPRSLWLLLLLIPCNPFFLVHAAAVMPDPLFLLFCLISLLLLERYLEGRSARWRTAVGLGLIVMAAVSVRVVGLTLLAPVLWLALRRREFPLLVGGILPTVGLLLAASHFGWLKHYGTTLPSTPFAPSLQVAAANLVHYMKTAGVALTGRFFQPPLPGAHWRLFEGAIFVVIGMGFIRHWRSFGAGWGIFTLGYAAAVVTYRFQDARYLFPLFPFLLYFLLQGFQGLTTSSKLRMAAYGGIFLMVALTGLGLTWYFPHLVWSPHLMNTPDLVTYRWIKSHSRPGDLIHTISPQRLYLYTERKGIYQKREEQYQMLDYLYSSGVRYLHLFPVQLGVDAAGKETLGVLDYPNLVKEDPRHFRRVFWNPGTGGEVHELLPLRDRFRAALAKTDEGALAFQQGDHRKAIAALKEALELEPDFYLAENLLGIVLVENGRPEEGLQILKRSAALHPSVERGYAALAYAYAKMGDRPRAIEQMETALGLAVRHGHPRLSFELRGELDNLRSGK